MPRSKPYTGKLMTLDIILVLFTGGFWFAVMFFRELLRWGQPTQK